VHDTPLKLCRERPAFAVELADELLGIPMPDHDEVLAYSESATDVEVRDLNADNVVVCRKGKWNRIGIIVEVQREKDCRKHFSWPAYQANIRHRIQAPVLLIVVCPKPSVAAWAAEPIETGQPGSHFRMQVLSSANYPKLTEPSGTGALAERMVLGTLIHEHADDIEQLLTVAAEELASRSDEVAKRYTEYMLGQLSEHPRTILEALMQQETYPYQSKLLADRRAEGKVEGKVEGEADALLTVIEARGLPITASQRRQIEDCKDLNRLKSWLKRVATAPSVVDIIE
jgi:ribosomal protein L13E